MSMGKQRPVAVALLGIALAGGTVSADAAVLATGPSLSGDARVEIAAVGINGDVVARLNVRGLDPMAFGDSATIATGFTAANTKFADLDGDGKTDIMAVNPDTGNIVAWHNCLGFARMPWCGDSVIVATGFHDATRVLFADLNGDRKAEILHIQSNGEVRAWRNARGFDPSPWGESVIIATGFTPNRTAFADLDADGKAEIMAFDVNTSTSRAWHNIRGFAPMPYGESVTIERPVVGSPFFHADVDGDGRADLIIVDPETLRVHAQRNDDGFSPTPWSSTSVVIATGFAPINTFFI
jgi:hypothetical protein